MFLHCKGFVFYMMTASYSALPRIGEKVTQIYVERNSPVVMENCRTVQMYQMRVMRSKFWSAADEVLSSSEAQG